MLNAVVMNLGEGEGLAFFPDGSFFLLFKIFSGKGRNGRGSLSEHGIIQVCLIELIKLFYCVSPFGQMRPAISSRNHLMIRLRFFAFAVSEIIPFGYKQLVLQPPEKFMYLIK
ncbi:hypothetical protein CEXT_357931 [Caerostris extrusa]|uniref:Uncharacterized protein n=1 Tax=Caerostris extrusa TaxID=172846 RepID=A0AAV4XT92_CAEEX|nr:hypothetical protein CEXT_357931 [Caerostris extrusa]